MEWLFQPDVKRERSFQQSCGVKAVVLLAGPPDSFDSLRAVLRDRYEALSPHLKRLARLALDDPDAVAFATVAALAERAEVQPSSVVRLAKLLGYSGFSEMQRVFRLRLVEAPEERRQRVFPVSRGQRRGRPDGVSQLLHDIIEANAGRLAALEAEIPPARLERAVRLLRAARVVHVLGLRGCFPLAAYLFYGLIRLERGAQLLDGAGGFVQQQVASMAANDLLVAISFPDYSSITVEAVEAAAGRGMPILAITDSEVSPLARHATEALLLGEDVNQPFRPPAAAVCLIQTLLVANATRRGDGKLAGEFRPARSGGRSRRDPRP
jgi:DNA-binding MurR/RpiR family transcriptional regulator